MNLHEYNNNQEKQRLFETFKTYMYLYMAIIPFYEQCNKRALIKALLICLIIMIDKKITQSLSQKQQFFFFNFQDPGLCI